MRPMACSLVADYHINVQPPNWMPGKGQYIFNWKYEGLLMAWLELGGFMSPLLDGIEGNGVIHWEACMSPDLLPIIYIPLKSISAEGHSQPEWFHIKSFPSQNLLEMLGSPSFCFRMVALYSPFQLKGDWINRNKMQDSCVPQQGTLGHEESIRYSRWLLGHFLTWFA